MHGERPADALGRHDAGSVRRAAPNRALGNEYPEGAIFHVAWFDGGGINVIEVWDSREQFDRFMQDRLAPGLQQVGVESRPDVTWSDAHAVFNPAADPAGARV